MWPDDQAAGLRAPTRARAIALLSACHDAAPALAHALQARGRRVLLVDLALRHATAPTVCMVLDWRQQVQQGRVFGLPPGAAADTVAVLPAAGAHAGEPALRQAAVGYDTVLFDAPWPSRAAPLACQTDIPVLLDIRPPVTAEAGYAVLKALVRAGAVPWVTGDAGAQQVVRAAQQFLGSGTVREAPAHWAVLAGRIDAYNENVSTQEPHAFRPHGR